MKKLICAALLWTVAACTQTTTEQEIVYWEEPDYNRIAAHTTIVAKTSQFVTYEYRDIRVDEVAPIAALYCLEQNGRHAVLYDIIMQPSNARRATFMCKKPNSI